MVDMRLRKRQNGSSSSKDLVLVCSIFIFSTCALLDAYLCFFVTSHATGPRGVTLPIERNHSCFQPFCIINAKGLLLDPANFYIHTPLSDILVSKLGIQGDYFRKANFITFAHVPVALIAAKFISKDSLLHRRIGVFIFEIRNFLDCLDGSIARFGMKQQKKMMAHIHEEELIVGDSPQQSFGFWIDGVCDTIGCVFLYMACIWYIRKHPKRRSSVAYSPLPVATANNSISQNLAAGNLEMESSLFMACFVKLRQFMRSIYISGGFHVILFGLQTGLGSAVWNRYIVAYTKILESSEDSPLATNPWVTGIRSGLLHSPMMWVVCYAWRYVNPHCLVEILLIAVFFNRIHELLNALKWLGFVVLCVVICFTEVHLYACKQMLKKYIKF